MYIEQFICLFIYWWMFGLFPSFDYRESVLLRICLYKYLFENLFSILLTIHLEVELLGCTVILCLTFRRATKLFFTAAEPFYIPASDILGYSYLCWHFSSLIANLVSIKWYLIVVLIYISLKTKDIELFFHVLVDHLHNFFGKMSIHFSKFQKISYLIFEYEYFSYSKKSFAHF